MFRRIAASIALCVTIAACSSGPKIRADVDPTANMASYKTFGFFDRLATDTATHTTILTQHLKAATQRELEKRGYQLAATNPQLLVNFNINVENRTDVRSTPSAGMGYYGYRAGYYSMWAGYPQDISTVHYQEGTLSVDLVDSARKQLVWSGVAEGRIKDKALQNPGPAIDATITSIFQKFPVPAPGAQ